MPGPNNNNPLSKLLSRSRLALARALKKARRFESRKLLRRVRSLRSNGGGDVGGVEVQVQALKAVDIQFLAGIHLRRSLHRDCGLRDALAGVEVGVGIGVGAGAGDGKEDGGKVERDVAARLCRAKGVREVVAVVLEKVRGAVGLRGGGIGGVARGWGEDGMKGEGGGGEADDQREEGGAEEEARERVGGEGEGEEAQEEAGGPEEAEEAEAEEETEEAGEEAKEAEREQTPLSAATSQVCTPSPAPPAGTDHPPHLSRAPDDWSGSESSSSTPPPPQRKRPTAATTTTTTKGTSVFLPTLLSGYISGSSSDSPSSTNKRKKKKGPPEKKLRKNRMGQQARRALWIKKYGNTADHIKKAKASQPPGKAQKRGDEKDMANVKTKAKAYDATGKADDGSLHPSWEAARRAKELTATIRPAGKKIVFED